MRVMFMGTPDFAVPGLKGLIHSHHEVVGVVTQPDQKRGRGHQVQMPPIKHLALEHNLKVYQPKRVKDPEFVEVIRRLNPDVIVVSAFGQILSQTILDLPKFGCINVHGSLLPKYRGAAPIHWAVVHGEVKTGITIQQMVYALDAGDILHTAEVVIDSHATTGMVHDRLSAISNSLILETLDLIENNKINPVPQDPALATYAPLLKKSMGEIDFNQSPQTVYNLIRGMQPWPGAYFMMNGATIKVFSAQLDLLVTDNLDAKPGTLMQHPDGLMIMCAGGPIWITELQAPGKKRMSAKAYCLGHTVPYGQILRKEV